MSNRINLWTIHVTANDFRPIRRWETSCILDSDWSKILRCDMYRPKIDAVGHCIFKTLPPCYFRVLCTSNQRQCIERFVWEDAWYIRLQVRHDEKVRSTEGICFQRHFDSDDLRKAIFASLIGRCVPVRTISWESNIHGGTFHNAEQFSIVVSFTALELRYDKYYIKCTHLWLVYVTRKFAEWPLDMDHSVGHVSPCIVWRFTSENFNQKLQSKISKSATLTSRLVWGWGWCSIKF